jgi:hypothetical protein
VFNLIKISLGAGFRPLTEDEHLYLRLCKLGKFDLALYSKDRHMLLK